MLIGGMYLLITMNKIPQMINWLIISKSAWSDMLVGLSKLFQSIIAFGSLLLIFSLVLLGLILLLGGLWRLLRVISRYLSSKRPSKKSLGMMRRR